MICQRNHLFNILVTTTLFFISTTVLVAGERDELYTEGIAAYSNQDHVEALKKLYAFYVLNEAEIKKRPDFEEKLKEKISTSEAILKLSFATNSTIQKGDKRIKFITRQSGGSFTASGMEVNDLLNKKAIDLKAIQELNHKTLTVPN